MDLKQINYDGIRHGTLKDLLDNVTYEIFTKGIKNGNGLPKYFTSLKMDARTVGYIYYTTDFNEHISDFIGIEVLENYRSRGLSNAIFELYFALCQENSVKHFKTRSQRKPFTTFLLMKNGYIPNSHSPKRRAYVLRPTDERLRIAFNDKEYESKFLESRLHNSGQYLVVNLDDEEILTTVQLQSRYMLSNFELLTQRRSKNKDRFSIDL